MKETSRLRSLQLECLKVIFCRKFLHIPGQHFYALRVVHVQPSLLLGDLESLPVFLHLTNLLVAFKR